MVPVSLQKGLDRVALAKSRPELAQVHRSLIEGPITEVVENASLEAQAVGVAHGLEREVLAVGALSPSVVLVVNVRGQDRAVTFDLEASGVRGESGDVAGVSLLPALGDVASEGAAHAAT